MIIGFKNLVILCTSASTPQEKKAGGQLSILLLSS
jgi:hypothetical protein